MLSNPMLVSIIITMLISKTVKIGVIVNHIILFSKYTLIKKLKQYGIIS